MGSESIFVFWLLFVLIVYSVLIYAIMESCSQRGRSTAAWVILSFIITPLLVLLCLAVMGETDEKRREKIIGDKNYFDNYYDDN